MKVKLYLFVSLLTILSGCVNLKSSPFVTDMSKTENIGTIAGITLGTLAADMATEGKKGKNKTRALVGGAAIGMISGHVIAKYASDMHHDYREMKKKEKQIELESKYLKSIKKSKLQNNSPRPL